MSSPLILHNNHEPFLEWMVTRNKRQQSATTSSMDGPRSSSKALSKARRAPKKHVTVWWFAAHLIYYSFPNPGETITCEKYAQQINEMHRKLQCLQPALVKRMGSILLHDNSQLLVTQSTLQKLNESCYKVLPHPPRSLDRL